MVFFRIRGSFVNIIVHMLPIKLDFFLKKGIGELKKKSDGNKLRWGC
jgi:hypothetical protein